MFPLLPLCAVLGEVMWHCRVSCNAGINVQMERFLEAGRGEGELREKVLHLNFFATFWSNSCLLRLENSSNLIKYPHLGITKPCNDFQGPDSTKISKRANPIHFLLFLLPDIKHMKILVSQTESNCQLKVHLTSLDDYFGYSLWIKLVLRSPK